MLDAASDALDIARGDLDALRRLDPSLVVRALRAAADDRAVLEANVLIAGERGGEPKPAPDLGHVPAPTTPGPDSPVTGSPRKRRSPELTDGPKSQGEQVSARVELEELREIATDPRFRSVHATARLRLRLAPPVGRLRTGGVQDVVAALVAFGATLQMRGERVQLAPALAPRLDFSIPAIQARSTDLPSLPPRDGSGVLLGVVDYGCDFVHPAFRHPNGRTRLVWLWDHNDAPPGATPPYLPDLPTPFGRRWSADVLDRALASPDPYWAIAYDPRSNPYTRSTANTPVHGTHVMGVAAGGGRGSPAGVAPGADLAFVHLRPPALAESLTLANGGEVAQAVSAIFASASELGQPTVVNLSLGTNAGPHDGTNVLESMFDAMLQVPGRALVTSAGNAYQAQRHARAILRPGQRSTVRWLFQQQDSTSNILDAYYDTPGVDPILRVAVIDPDGRRTEQETPADILFLRRKGELRGVLATGVWPRGGGHTQSIHIWLDPGARAETWQLEFLFEHGNGVPTSVTLDAWIDRDDALPFAASQFHAEDADPHSTLDSLACANLTVCVGAYYEITPAQGITPFSSAGPTRDGRPKPDVVAPGWQVRAANALGGQPASPAAPNRVPLTAPARGTSVSSPHVAGVAALMLQTRPELTAEQIGDVLRRTTQLVQPNTIPTPVPPGGLPRTWDPRFGYGRVDAAAAVGP